MAYVIWLGVISCAGPLVADHPPVAAPCSPMRIGAVSIVGAPRRSVPALEVLAGTIDDPLRQTRVVGQAIEQLRARGYSRASIDVAREAGCFVDLHVHVTLGARYQIDAIEFETSPGDEFPARARLSAIEDALGTVNTIGGVYIAYRLRRALHELEDRYRDAGWLEASIGDPVVHYTDDDRIELAIPVTAGPRFRIAAIRARGAGARARAAVLEELAIEPGAYYDGVAIRTGIERARHRLDRRVELRTRLSQDRALIELEAVLPGSSR